VARIGERINNLHALELKSTSNEQADVTAHRTRVAAHEYESIRLRGKQPVHCLRSEAGPGGVRNHDIRGTGAPGLHPAFVDIHVRAEVDSGVRHRGRGDLNCGHRLRRLPDTPGKQPHPCVGIEQRLARQITGRNSDHVDECLRRGWAGLKERTRRDAPVAPGNPFGDEWRTRFASWCGDGRHVVGDRQPVKRAIDDREPFARGIARPDGHFVRRAPPSVDEQFLNARVSNKALAGRHNVVTGSPAVPRTTVRHGRAHGRPIRHRIERAEPDDPGHVDLRDPFQRIGDHRKLHLLLQLTGRMAEVAAAASGSGGRTCGDNSTVSGFQHLDYVAAGEAFFLRIEGYPNNFTRQAAGREDHPTARITANTGTATGCSVELQFDHRV